MQLRGNSVRSCPFPVIAEAERERLGRAESSHSVPCRCCLGPDLAAAFGTAKIALLAVDATREYRLP
jgi:hypothetical protein